MDFLFTTRTHIQHVAGTMLNTLGNFGSYTRNYDCGTFEYVLNTPSHHRMHHRPPEIVITWGY